MTLLPFPRRAALLLVGMLTPATVVLGEQVVGNGHPPARGAVLRAATAPQGDALSVTVRPENGVTAGVAMPVILRFGSDIAPARRAALLDHIQVASVPATLGAWHWFSASEVHWRPVTYWSPGTQVEVIADLDGVSTGGDVVGRGSWFSSFTIGPKHVSIIDTRSHEMRVYEGDRLIHTWPVSTGRRDLQTIDGILYVRYKDQDVLMDSESIGIPRKEWDGYHEHVFWDTAISTDGFYVHGAPWSVAEQGVTNVSHGCVNLSSEHAQDFFEFSNVGDIVTVRGSTRPATGGDGEGDWQMTFAQFARPDVIPHTVF